MMSYINSRFTYVFTYLLCRIIAIKARLLYIILLT